MSDPVLQLTGTRPTLELNGGRPSLQIGPNGLRGATAYEVALNNGFAGTLEQWLYRTGAHARDFGIREGTDNDWTSELRNLFDQANAYGAPVYFHGIDRVWCQKDASGTSSAVGLNPIRVNTDVYGGGCRLRPIDAIVDLAAAADASPSSTLFSGIGCMWLIEDPACPLVETDGVTLSASNLGQGSRTPFGDNWSDDAARYVKLKSQVNTGGRNGGTLPYTQPFLTGSGGIVDEPLAMDISAGPTGNTMWTRLISPRRINISGFRVDPADFNNQCIFWLRRGNARIGEVFALPNAGENLPDSVNQLILCDDVALVDLENIPGMAMNPYSHNGTTNGSYLIELRGFARVRMHRIGARSGDTTTWGAIGTHHGSGLTLSESYVNRLDVHDNGFAFRSRDNVYDSICIRLGQGGLYVISENDRFEQTQAGIELRTDYPGHWPGGGWFLVNPTFDNQFSSGIYGIRAMGDGASGTFGSNAINVQMPAELKVSGGARIDRTLGDATGTFTAIGVKVNTGSDYVSRKVYAPSQIVIEGLESTPASSFTNIIALADMEQFPRQPRTKVKINGLQGSAGTSWATRATAGTLIVPPRTAGRAPTTPVRLDAEIERCNYVYADVGALADAAVAVRGCRNVQNVIVRDEQRTTFKGSIAVVTVNGVDVPTLTLTQAVSGGSIIGQFISGPAVINGTRVIQKINANDVDGASGTTYQVDIAQTAAAGDITGHFVSACYDYTSQFANPVAPSNVFMGRISGTTLTLDSDAVGDDLTVVGRVLSNTVVTLGGFTVTAMTKVTARLSGDEGKAGATYTVDTAQTCGSTSITATAFTAPFGNASTDFARATKMFASSVQGLYDLSNVTLFSGVDIMPYSQIPKLPAALMTAAGNDYTAARAKALQSWCAY